MNRPMGKILFFQSSEEIICKKRLSLLYIIDIVYTLCYNIYINKERREQMAKHKKRNRIDWKEIAVTSIIQFLIGLVLLIIDKITK